jgi:hypothetical protein
MKAAKSPFIYHAYPVKPNFTHGKQEGIHIPGQIFHNFPETPPQIGQIDKILSSPRYIQIFHQEPA